MGGRHGRKDRDRSRKPRFLAIVIDYMKQFWDERYREAGFAYGVHPNAFFKSQLEKLPAGRLLLPAEGEGRNAVFAAGLGWEVNAFDQSSAGRDKALQLAQDLGVAIHYAVHEFRDLEFARESFDAIALIYAHFPEALRLQYHQMLLPLLKPGGHFIVEGFSKAQLTYQQQYQSGGPQDPGMLYDLPMLQSDFGSLEILSLEEQEIELEEGKYHVGKAGVIRMLARKWMKSFYL